MSELQELVQNLEETSAAVENMARALESAPDDDVLKINAASICRRRDDLVRRLDYALHTKQQELIRYRIMRDWTDAYPAKAVAASMLAFQELVTSVFDAIRSQPKQRYRPSLENIALSTFDFAGAAAGSVVISLAVPNDRLLVGETELDETLGLVERALSARESGDLKALAEKIGIASIAKAYAWAETSVAHEINTEIRWGKSYSAMQELTITRDEARVVKEVIENKSDTIADETTIEGVLLGFDGATSYFHLETIGDRVDIRGNLADDLSRAWMTDQLYRAQLLRTAQVRYATGEEKVQWTLLALTPLTPPSA